MNIGAKLNKIENRQQRKSIKPKAILIFLKINKIDNLLARLIKEEEGEGREGGQIIKFNIKNTKRKQLGIHEGEKNINPYITQKQKQRLTPNGSYM